MEIKENVSLKDYSTYKIGGSAAYFSQIKEEKDLQEAVDFIKRNELKSFFLGGGSNVLFSDAGFDGLVAKIDNDALDIVESAETKVKVRCGAGVPLGMLVAFCSREGLTGFEWAAGIPGTVGGAIRGNAGAFGGEMKERILSVTTIDISTEDLQKHEIDVADCEFEYRDSLFKSNEHLIIWEMLIEVDKKDKEEIQKEVKEIIRKRNENQPEFGKFPSVGCMFKNPVVSRELIDKFEFDQEKECKSEKIPAGWLIERCDLKGERIGDAMINEKQANFIVNMGAATSEDVIILMSLIKMKVRNKYKVQLEEEVKIVG